VSKSKGHHVWIFCSEPIIAAALRALVDFAMQQAGITNYELFPKQDALVQDAFKKWNFGNYINLPLYGKDVVNGRTTFLDHTDSFMPFTNGCVWAFLQGAKRLSKGDVDDIIAKHSLKPSLKVNAVTHPKTPAQPNKQSATVQQIKPTTPQPVINIASQPKVKRPISALEILRFFGIQLQDERIQNDELIACCPFHTEKTASFFLNIPGGYYHCFGCGEKGYIKTKKTSYPLQKRKGKIMN